MLRLFQAIGAGRAAKQLGVPEFHVRLVAKRAGVAPNPTLRWQHFRDNPSQLELDLYGYLDTLGVQYEAQKAIGRYVVDAFIEPNIIIEADGDWWHGHPRFEPLTKTQRKQKGRDKARNTYLANRSYAVIRIWECDMSLERVKRELIARGILS